MPRGSNGVYTLPVGAFSPVTTIQSAQVNSDFSDIAVALTQSLATTGVSAMTAQLPGFPGTAPAPGYAFSTDGTSGMFSPGNGQVALAAGGQQVLTVTSGGVSVVGTLTSTQGAIPVGTVAMFAGTAAPSGWHFCDGSSKSTTTFAALFAAIGYTYGGAGANFNLPDARGRVIAGFDSGAATGRLTDNTAQGVSAATLGTAGGEQSHTLNLTETAAHNHLFTGSPATFSTNQSNINFGASSSVSSGAGINVPTSEGAATTTVTPSGTIGSAGGGATHNNVQPTLILNYIIFAGV